MTSDTPTCSVVAAPDHGEPVETVLGDERNEVTAASGNLPQGRLHWWWPRILLASALLFAFLARFAENGRFDHDVFHAISLWREAITAGQFPQGDVWAYTETLPMVVHHEWLTGALNYGLMVSTGWGPAALLWYKAICLTGALACMWFVAKSRGASGIVFALCTAVATSFMMISLATGRAQVSTVLLFSVLLTFLELDQRGKRWWIAAWIPLFVLWLNLHGGVVAGCGAFLFYTVERSSRLWYAHGSFKDALAKTWHLWATGICLFPLFLINPYGVEYATYLVEAISMDRSKISEWMPIYKTLPRNELLKFCLMLSSIVFSIWTLGVKKLPGILMALVLAYLGFKHTRQAGLFGIVWLAYAPAWLTATHFGEIVNNLWKKRPGIVAAVVGIWGVTALVHLQTVGSPFQVKVPTTCQRSPMYYPTGLAKYLDENRYEGNMVTTFETGSWISWKFYPRIKVSFDSRYEAAFPKHVFEDTRVFYKAKPGWEEAFVRLDGDTAIIPRYHEIFEIVNEHPPVGWEKVYEDDAQILLMTTEEAARFPQVNRCGQPLSTDVL